MDDAIGRVLAKIHEHDQEENTLIFFLSDNGGPTNATTSRNGPLRGFKATTFEGGTCVPFCAQWKGKIAAGSSYSHPIQNLDILPTAVVAAGGEIDPSWKLDGVDLLPFLTGAKGEARPHETLYWRFGDQWAIRHGDYKLVVANGGSGRPELYDLGSDLGESNDLAIAQPEKATELLRLWQAWSAEQAEPTLPKEANQSAKQAAKNKKKSSPIPQEEPRPRQ
jgi:arylsulfatase A-like enzyme